MGVITKNITKAGITTYQAKCRRKGFPVISKTFRELKDAKAFIREVERGFDLGELPESVKPAAPPSEAEGDGTEFTTLADILRSYRDEAVPKQRSSEIATMKIDLLLEEPLAKTAIADLKAALAKWRDDRLKEVKAGTVLREMNLIYAAINRARVEHNVEIPDVKIARPKAPAARTRRLEAGELDRILESAKRSRSKGLSAAILLAIETGARAGELINLRWEFVDVSKRTAHFPITKNGYSRTIPLSSRAVAILEGMPREGERVLHGMTSRTLKRAWVLCRERAGIEGLRFHDMRREGVSRMIERGLSVVEVAQVSGHRSLAMLQVYARPTAESIAAKLG
ncbi:site-specific integrase [Cupriavidus sp. BIS7]|uniref:site-specific integrase n=1 Tax=Cupriavidus sp. BIS7 TaxID=1217718 RepID=UPI00036D126C|nr:site-specific integrase [Cupriavidus sp. BIS7]